VKDDFPIDILIHPRHLPYILTLLKEFPSLRAVIDHIAKPDIANGVLEPWKEYIQEIARFKNVMCKLSGMVTEAKPPYAETITPFVHFIIQAFGPNSVIFGSDWPVCLLASSYHEVYDILTHSLPKQLTIRDQQAIFGENAARFYKLT
jgi:L-fuconolactonase